MTKTKWVAWDGNIEPTEEPVQGKVTVRFRDGEEDTDDASVYWWGHEGGFADIIAYCVLEGEPNE